MVILLNLIGAACLIYCAVIFIFGTFGSWFFLIWGAAGAACLALAQLLARGIWRALPGAFRMTALAVFGLGLLLFCVIEGLIISRFGSKGPKNLDYLVVLGAQIWESGPSRALQLRLDTACAYLEENENTLVIVSGGQGSNEPMSEAQGMYDYLVKKGISPERIFMEDRSTNTHENLLFSKAFIQKEDAQVGIVTNNFHVYRATRLADKLGYEKAYGIAAPSDKLMQANNMVREFFGVMKDWAVGNM